jgi:hypothetical protein
MPRRIVVAFVLLAVGVVIGVTLRPNIAADPPKDEKKEKPIPIEEVRKRGVLGELGHPLGTIVRIEGLAEVGEPKDGKAADGKTLLRVQSVNAQKLTEKVTFFFDGVEADNPKGGAKFKYIGYETGEFDGQVRGNDLYTPTLLGGVSSYGFVRRFWIVKDELKPEKK